MDLTTPFFRQRAPRGRRERPVQERGRPAGGLLPHDTNTARRGDRAREAARRRRKWRLARLGERRPLRGHHTPLEASRERRRSLWPRRPGRGKAQAPYPNSCRNVPDFRRRRETGDERQELKWRRMQICSSHLPRSRRRHFESGAAVKRRFAAWGGRGSEGLSRIDWSRGRVQAVKSQSPRAGMASQTNAAAEAFRVKTPCQCVHNRASSHPTGQLPAARPPHRAGQWGPKERA